MPPNRQATADIPKRKSAPAATLPPTQRSAVTNGARLFVEGQDGNSPWYRRYKDLVTEFTRDIGGDPSEAQKQLIRRAASLSTWCEAQEVRLTNGEEVEIGPLTTASNSLRRILADIGLERKPRDVSQTERLRRLIEGECV
ncbi:hypothetical protein [Sinorhizobium fredii]|uniref:hypothetical protein n=1 Tax=Rhizobium fredii TaxID=380 RepID=UPI0004B2F38A|nr:hypothetical protein [Sinorhizobium fredii]AWI57034.1 hypothetical protein AB395_00001368 [Sinorhizobium fredii CCBAU 45436]